MIEVKNISKKYGSRFAIKNLSFKIKKGDVVGFLGPNGAGKTTTIKILTGAIAPSSGEVYICEENLFKNPISVKKKIGYLPELPPVYVDMRVKDYLKFVADIKCVPKNKVKENVSLAIEKVQLQDVSDRLIRNLSKGFRQRVGIAQSLVSLPEVLILDEPTVGLDPSQVAEVRKLINEFKGDHTIMLSTHILSEVKAICDHVIIINKGQIVAQENLKNVSEAMTASTIAKSCLQSQNKNLKIRVRRHRKSLALKLEELSFVYSVDETGDEIHLSIGSNEDQHLDDISKLIVEEDAGLLEMQFLDNELEDMFINLTQELPPKKGDL